MANADRDDLLTLIAISTLAYILADILHEGLGHGVVALMSGAHRITISTLALQSDVGNEWISAAGTVVNLVAAAVLWLLLRVVRRMQPATRIFLVLTLAANLFTGTGYFFYSGVANFGDWAAVIQDLEPHWLWRVGLIAIGAATYYASMLVIADQLRPFMGPDRGSRIRTLCWTPYLAEAALAFVAGLFNPMGFFYVVASGLSSTLGANAGFLSLPLVMRAWNATTETAGPIVRSLPWIAAGAIASALCIFVLGRGLTWSR
jgi:hypothetical protein